MKALGIRLEGAVDSTASAVLDATHRVVVNGQFYWASSPQQTAVLRASPHSHTGPVRDPVTGQWFSPMSTSPRRDLDERIFLFVSATSAGAFDRDPERTLE